MNKVSAAAAQVLGQLVSGLEVGESRTIDNTNGVFQAVHVDRLAEYVFSVAHYFEQQGDLVPDPDMTFLRGGDGGFYPLTFQNCLTYTEAVVLDAGGRPERWSPKTQRSLAVFASTWMLNIGGQQGLG